MAEAIKNLFQALKAKIYKGLPTPVFPALNRHLLRLQHLFSWCSFVAPPSDPSPVEREAGQQLLFSYRIDI